jgi:hypothetical protein
LSASARAAGGSWCGVVRRMPARDVADTAKRTADAVSKILLGSDLDISAALSVLAPGQRAV